MKKIKEKLQRLFRAENVTGAAITALLIGAVIVINVIVYALTVGYGLYYTPTEELDMSISDASDEKFSSYSGDGIDVIFCRSSVTFDDETGTKDQTYYFHKTAKEFEAKYPGLVNIKYVNVLTKRMEPDNKIYERLSDYQKNGEGETAYPLYESSVIFDNLALNKFRVVTDTAAAAFYANDSTDTESYQAYVGEEVFSSMISWVLAKDTKKAYFTTYHGESSEVYFASMLACAGYEIDILNLRKQNVPDDADLLIISNPTQDFEESVEGGPTSEMDRLRKYLSDGGSLYVSLDPYAKKLGNFEGLLAEYGISYIESTVEGQLYKNIVRDTANSTTADNFTLLAEFSDSAHAEKIADVLDRFDSGRVRLRECAALSVSGKAEALLTTSSSSAIYAGGERTDKSGSYCIGAVSPTKDASGMNSGNIFVVSSIYLTANDSLMTKGCANRDFIYSVFDFVFNSNNAPYGCTPIHFNNESLENFTMRTARMYTVLILTVPVIIAVVGVVILKKRKNR